MIESKVFDELNDRTLPKRIDFFKYEDECVEHGEEVNITTLLLRTQKIQLLKRHLERWVQNFCHYLDSKVGNTI